MRCEGNICRESVPQAEGTLGGPCSEDGSCEAEQDLSLMCVQGRCELAGCPSGEVGCGCGPYGACAPGSRCLERMCVASSCAVGAPGCPCDETSPCVEGYACNAGLCRRATLTFSISPPEARACDILLADEQEWINTTAIDASTKLAMKTRDGKVGIATFRTDDTPYSSASIKLTSTEKPYIIRPAVRVQRATCYDANGNALESTEVSLHEE